jgi:hypothetical protein
MANNPFDPEYQQPAPAPADDAPAAPLITQAGAYSDVPIEAYHGGEICPAPSLSATGAKKLAGRGTKGCTPRHFWEASNLNPNRKPQEDTDALRFGRALHDALLLPERWSGSDCYHVTCEGFSRAKTKALAIEIEAAAEAEAAGMTIVSADDAMLIDAMVAAVRANKLANLLLTNGEPEVTLAGPDPKLGVWRRARPDFLPHKKQIITDVKTAADASFEGFSRAVKDRRYDLAAAMQLDLIGDIFGPDPARRFVHLVIEKPAKYRPGDYIPVALWELPSADILRGHHLYRRALNVFADCLRTGEWPGYADQPAPCGLPTYEAKQIDEGVTFDGVTHHQKEWMEAA